jgi:membrane protein
VPALRRLVEEVVEEFRQHDLLSHASAIAFQLVFAALPVLLAGLAVMGFLGLSETWTGDVSPRVRGAVPADVFSVVDRTVRSVLTGRRGEWLTVGLLLTVFKVSSVVRTVAPALNHVYGSEEDRPWIKRFIGSLLIAAVVLPCALLGPGGVVAGGQVAGVLGIGGAGTVLAWIVRWLLVVVLLLVTVWLVLRVAPAGQPQVHLVSLGAGIVVLGWILATLAYGFYATTIAGYGTVFGSLASVVVLITYAYILAVVFLAGVSADDALRRRLRERD